MTAPRSFGTYTAVATDETTQIVHLVQGSVVARLTPDENGKWAIAATNVDGSPSVHDAFDGVSLTEKQIVLRLRSIDLVARLVDGAPGSAQSRWPS